ncbi:RNase adapter RapZ [Facklamia sp. P12945]|uniref:RNase adapter RapZ n=1 Tax=unclassified Facklamia TaxID=2622293 RepID=UPI003D16D072
MSNLELVIITGMSGAGKTVAVQSFEDLGYYCIDNMPPSLLPTFWQLMRESGKITKIAMVIDLRTREFFDELSDIIGTMDNNQDVTSRILFLEANDQELVSRYKESRRHHPLSQANEVSTLSAIAKEKELLRDLRTRAQMIVDTSEMKPRQLRAYIMEHFAEKEQVTFRIDVVSFGFKYGLPIDADVVMDVRFLPNPYYIQDLRGLTGVDNAVYDYVMSQPESQIFYNKLIDLLNYCVPGYKREGKSRAVIAIGCTGGQHRSVALAERIGEHFTRMNYCTNVNHRDMAKNQNQVLKKVARNESDASSSL